jgi:FG-GAP-like repeat/Thrombospondin type 3 repeat
LKTLASLVVVAAGVFAPAALAGDGTFVAAPLVASPSPTFVGIGDFNLDGDQDLAVVNAVMGDNMAIRRGAAGATFIGSPDVTQGNSPQEVVIGDWNIDGDQDLAISNLNGGIVPVRTGRPGAGFDDAPDIAAGNTTDIAVGDFNGDGEDDLAIIDVAVNLVRIRTGTGGTDATFGAAANIDLGAGSPNQPSSIAAGDFNNDGDEDLAVTKGGPTVAIFTGTGASAATFAPAPDVAVPADQRDIVIADFDDDGDQDLATIRGFGGPISIRTGGAGATFAAAPDVPTGPSGFQLALGDFNSDGDEDLAIGGRTGGGAFIRTGSAGATFAAGPDAVFGGGSNPAVGDFDVDGNQDLAMTASGAVAIATGGGARLHAHNLLANGGAEEGVGDSTLFASPAVPSWTSTGPLTFVRYSTWGFAPRRLDAQGWEGGEEFFSGGPSNALSSASQTVAVPLAPVSIDAGLATATLTADLGGYRLVNDRMQVTAQFLDGAGTPIGSFTIGTVTAADRANLTTLVRRTGTQPMPAGTRSIQVILTAIGASAGYNFAYADNVMLTVATEDDDADGIAEGADNCPDVANSDQANLDGDAEGDACDGDDENDGVLDATDNCPALANPDQADADADGRGDPCDEDDDGDAVADASDRCPLIAGVRSNGCPRIARRVSLAYKSRAERFDGRVRPRGECAARQRVGIFRARRGRDARIGRPRTNRSGRFRLEEDARPGRYYARIAARTIPGVGNCTGARSKRVGVG